MTTAPLVSALPIRPSTDDRSANLCAIVLAIALTLVVRGYQFGRSNHTVYLLDSLRVNDPTLLANDWYTTHTLQYHFVFTHLTAAFDRMGILRPAYLVGYLALIVFFQIAWFLLNQTLGGTRRTYLLSVLLYYLSAGGAGLGVFCFMQDSAFVPSNISNIAMLWAIYFWITRRPIGSALLFGVAGFFHLNHALVAIALWGALILWDHYFFSESAESARSSAIEEKKRVPPGLPLKSVVTGTILVLAMCLPNLIPAARASLGGPHKIPLKDFVDLYVHLRHPHHYDPLSWPIALWISFLWPFPLAILAIRRLPKSPQIREACRVSLILCAMMLVAFFFAGVWFISEPLVQASLFRFSIYPKLLTCIGAGVFVGSLPKNLGKRFQLSALSNGAPIIIPTLVLIVFPMVVFFPWSAPARAFATANATALISLLGICLVIGSFEDIDQKGAIDLKRLRQKGQGLSGFVYPTLAIVSVAYVGFAFQLLGLREFVGFDPTPEYKSICDYAREHTPADAIFLVPPEEQEFRLLARRAIVINFKGVAQLSSELGEWRDRLCRVLDIPSLSVLPHHFDQVFDAMAKRYAELPPDHLRKVAGEYHARYIVTTHPFPAPAVADFESGRFHLYDLQGKGR